MPRVNRGQLSCYTYQFKADAVQRAAARGLVMSTSAFLEVLLHWGARALLHEVRLRPGNVPPDSLDELAKLAVAMDTLPNYGPIAPPTEVDAARRMIDDLEV